MERKGKIIIIICLLLVVAVGFFVFKIRANKQKSSGDQIGTSPSSSVNKINESEFKQALQATTAVDKDFDGLKDNEEQQYKTSPEDADTDGDGLSDWQEVVVFTTDPLKNDTDGDTFLDGYEVRRGFNPKGPGAL